MTELFRNAARSIAVFMYKRNATKFSDFAGWLALFGLLFQIFIPFFHHPAMAMPMEQGALMQHCGMAGMKPDTGSPKTEKKAPSCPICQTMHQLHAGFITPDVPSIPTINAQISVQVVVWQQLILTALIETAARPRAPPAFA